MKTFRVKIEVSVPAETAKVAQRKAECHLLALIGNNELSWSFFDDETEALSKQVQELETKLDALRGSK